MNETRSPFDQLCEQYRRAVYEKDVEAFVGLYDQEARVFDTWEVWSYEGREQRRKVIEQWFGSLGDERVSVTFDRLRVESGAALATLSARVVYVALSATGAELRAMQNRLTWVARSEGSAWKIVHEHTSVAISGNGLIGQLQRD